MTQSPDRLPPMTDGTLQFGEIRQLVGIDEPVVLDIGANDGTTTIWFMATFPKCKIYAFEPDARAFGKIKSRITSARVQIFETAIGAYDGEAEFHVSSGIPPGMDAGTQQTKFPEGWDQSGSLRAPKNHQDVWPWCKFEATRKVAVRKLDTFAREAGISQIDFIWADVQGAEGDLIAGARDTLARTRYFYTEYSNDEWFEGQPNLSRLMEMLDNFTIVKLFPMDVLFKNKML